jgi:hypothetical protein
VARREKEREGERAEREGERQREKEREGERAEDRRTGGGAQRGGVVSAVSTRECRVTCGPSLAMPAAPTDCSSARAVRFGSRAGKNREGQARCTALPHQPDLPEHEVVEAVGAVRDIEPRGLLDAPRLVLQVLVQVVPGPLLDRLEEKVVGIIRSWLLRSRAWLSPHCDSLRGGAVTGRERLPPAVGCCPTSAYLVH